MVSAPAPPVIASTPPPPTRVSPLAPPVIVSLLPEPVMVAAAPVLVSAQPASPLADETFSVCPAALIEALPLVLSVVADDAVHLLFGVPLAVAPWVFFC